MPVVHSRLVTDVVLQMLPSHVFNMGVICRQPQLSSVFNQSTVVNCVSVSQTMAKRCELHIEWLHRCAVYLCRLQFVLGTEAGMITSIVRKVRHMIEESGRSDVAAEIVFPVSPDAITTAENSSAAAAPDGLPDLPGGLAVIPGAASGLLPRSSISQPVLYLIVAATGAHIQASIGMWSCIASFANSAFTDSA